MERVPMASFFKICRAAEDHQAQLLNVGYVKAAEILTKITGLPVPMSTISKVQDATGLDMRAMTRTSPKEKNALMTAVCHDLAMILQALDLKASPEVLAFSRKKG